MNLSGLNAFLAMAGPATPPGTAPDPKGQIVSTLGMFLIMGAMFYFVLIRPQQKKAKEHAELLRSVRPGDKVLTSSGIVGVVLTVKERTITVRSGDSKLEIAKSGIAEITERGGEASQS